MKQISNEKKISAEISSHVAIEAVRGVKTISEIASRYEVHPNQVSLWKKQFIKSASSTFCHPSSAKEKHHTEETYALYRKIGKLEVENDFLKKSGIS